ncbi:hypothetical protein C8R41DRAFT_817664 [Lentinula lateritia]|uniref:Reverse transcriptase zinc-binding domain-containing protein n=1 Tax=Lentinula lateritia TaxID=40482 RepID=A0ABQ8VW70_9AGAR|nr:hypothetical protein C8R41DRAFT_817664 [Lentinula lateritia]
MTPPRTKGRRPGKPKPQMIGLQHFLIQIPKHSHRRTITKLLCGDFTPQVFRASPSPLCQLTATENLNCLCHACVRHPETPQHILFQCPSLSSICSLRAEFITYIHQHRPVPFNAFFSDPDRPSLPQIIHLRLIPDYSDCKIRPQRHGPVAILLRHVY